MCLLPSVYWLLLSVIEEVRVSGGEKCKWAVLSPAKLFWWPHGRGESSPGQCGWWRNNPNTASILGVAPPWICSLGQQGRERRGCLCPVSPSWGCPRPLGPNQCVCSPAVCWDTPGCVLGSSASAGSGCVLPGGCWVEAAQKAQNEPWNVPGHPRSPAGQGHPGGRASGQVHWGQKVLV